MKAIEDILFEEGFGTRRFCRALVAKGQVLVMGEPCLELGKLFDENDLKVTVSGFDWVCRAPVLIALNKPAGYECSRKPSGFPSVFTLLPFPWQNRPVQCVGRLDAETSGLILLTDDGALNHRLTHPKKHVEKAYSALLKHPADPDMPDKLLRGVALKDSDAPAKALRARLTDPFHLDLVIDSGAYHVVRRMIAACSNRCEALTRTRIGKFSLPQDFAPGAFMRIKPEDVL